MDGMLGAEPGPDSSVLVSPVVFSPWPETGVVVDVTNVLGNPAALGIVELTKKTARSLAHLIVAR